MEMSGGGGAREYVVKDVCIVTLFIPTRRPGVEIVVGVIVGSKIRRLPTSIA